MDFLDRMGLVRLTFRLTAMIGRRGGEKQEDLSRISDPRCVLETVISLLVVE